MWGVIMFVFRSFKKGGTSPNDLEVRGEVSFAWSEQLIKQLDALEKHLQSLVERCPSVGPLKTQLQDVRKLRTNAYPEVTCTLKVYSTYCLEDQVAVIARALWLARDIENYERLERTIGRYYGLWLS